jgi:enamine deaminase RidA (YjgF/YER057c/UK114 family)
MQRNVNPNSNGPISQIAVGLRLAEEGIGDYTRAGMQAFEGRQDMNRRIGILVVALAVAGVFTVRGAFSQVTMQPTRKVIKLQGGPVEAPFSDAILSGNTLYLAGRIGLDPKTGKPPEKIEDEIKILLDGEKTVLAQAGMTMDDLVYVQVSCTDLTLFDTFNPIYKSYFTTKDYPAREFIGAGSLLRGGHFELQAIAVKR